MMKNHENLSQEDAKNISAVSHVLRTRSDDANEEIKKMASRLWLVSFADLFSLMLVFFLMIYATRDPDIQKIGAMSGTPPPGGYYEFKHDSDGGPSKDVNISRFEYGEALNLGYLQGLLQNALVRAKLENDVTIVKAEDHLRLQIPLDKIFIGDAALNSFGVEIAKRLAVQLNRLSNRITLMSLLPDSDSWGSSISLAHAFAQEMREGGYRKKLSVLASGEGSFVGIEIRIEADNGQIR